ncbi:MAG: hypothetical protein HC782_05040 [Gammaproteobacteria bacterium]|nr:hypothetical protein [Gammaproteobacteria bacterium]
MHGGLTASFEKLILDSELLGMMQSYFRPIAVSDESLSLDAIAEAVDVELEVFVHGALCVAYSGQCLTSEALGGRSANRGQCAQACRNQPPTAANAAGCVNLKPKNQLARPLVSPPYQSPPHRESRRLRRWQRPAMVQWRWGDCGFQLSSTHALSHCEIDIDAVP